jgi:hypothetical protein
MMTDFFMVMQQGYYWAGNVFSICLVGGLLIWGWTSLTKKQVEDSKLLLIGVFALIIAGILSWIVGLLTWIGITIGLASNSIDLVGGSWMTFYGGGLILVTAIIWSFISDLPALKWRLYWVKEIGILGAQGVDEILVWSGLIVGAIGWLLINLPF